MPQNMQMWNPADLRAATANYTPEMGGSVQFPQIGAGWMQGFSNLPGQNFYSDDIYTQLAGGPSFDQNAFFDYLTANNYTVGEGSPGPNQWSRGIFDSAGKPVIPVETGVYEDNSFWNAGLAAMALLAFGPGGLVNAGTAAAATPTAAQAGLPIAGEFGAASVGTLDPFSLASFSAGSPFAAAPSVSASASGLSLLDQLAGAAGAPEAPVGMNPLTNPAVPAAAGPSLTPSGFEAFGPEGAALASQALSGPTASASPLTSPNFLDPFSIPPLNQPFPSVTGPSGGFGGLQPVTGANNLFDGMKDYLRRMWANPWGRQALIRAGTGLYGNQRMRRMNRQLRNRLDSGDVTQMPGYQAGEKSVRRRMAAQGYGNSTNMLAALQDYGAQQYDRFAANERANYQAKVGSLANEMNTLGSMALLLGGIPRGGGQGGQGGSEAMQLMMLMSLLGGR